MTHRYLTNIFISLLSVAALPSGTVSATEHVSDSLVSIRRQSVPKRIRISDYPTTGERKSLVILAEFQDVRFSSIDNPYEYFDGLLNKQGFTHPNGADGSAKDFYIASSAGCFVPDFVVAGPVLLPHDLEYYGADIADWLDVNAHQMVVDACRGADEVVDFSEFDLDNNGEVDNVYIFYAGYGESETGEKTHLWPQSNMLHDNKDVDLTLDGVRINHYAYSNEIRIDGSKQDMPAGIGTFVHEFGHVLGISDHYDSTFAGIRPGVDQWDTMAAANYYNNMHTPPLFSAFERAELGWLEYTELTDYDNGHDFSLLPLSEENKAFRVTVPETEGQEYFVIENRQQTGWDAFLPGHGLLVWHIDMDREAWLSNNVNTDPEHNRVDIVEADGYESLNNLAGDPFPGKRKVTSFSFEGWNGRPVFSLSDITETPEGVLSFNFSIETSGLEEISAENDGCRIISIVDLTGLPVTENYRGVVIVRYADGTAKRILR